jgi:16S rRNA (uracil1498-N3)-methyltransferase
MDDICDGGQRMTIHRFFAHSSFFENGKVILRGDEGYHLARILRAKKGQIIRVFTEKGAEFESIITNVRGTEITAEIKEKLSNEVEPKTKIHIAQGMIKPAKMEIIIQKCTEIGVASFTPIVTEYSMAKPNQPDKQLQRWDKIALEATKQSERRIVPAIYNITGLDEYVAVERAGMKIYMDARNGSSPKKVLRSMENNRTVEEIYIAIGPEGGFSPKENDLFLEKSFIPIHLGPRVLRSETAAAVLASIFLYEFNEME